MTIILDNTLQLTATMTPDDMHTAIVDWAHEDFSTRGDTCHALLNVLERLTDQQALVDECERIGIDTQNIDTYEGARDRETELCEFLGFDEDDGKLMHKDLRTLFEGLSEKFDIETVNFSAKDVLASLDNAAQLADVATRCGFDTKKKLEKILHFIEDRPDVQPMIEKIRAEKTNAAHNKGKTP